MQDPTLQIGRSYPGGWKSVGFSAHDARYHTYVVGKTGSGKSTLLHNLVLQHARLGHGVGLIDPHGDLASGLLDHLPASRSAEVVYFDASDTGFPIGLNPLYGVPEDQRALAVSGIVEGLKNLWPDSWGPRMEYILQNAVAALLHCQNVSLLAVNRMLTEPAYRRWVVGQVRDPFVRGFWEHEFEKYDPRFRREAIAPIQNKLGQFALSPAVRNIIGQARSRISIPQVMDRGQIFVANLAKGHLGNGMSNLLGSLLVQQFELAAMARSRVPESERRDFFLVIDEFASFTTEAFATILSEARKYGLGLTLTHQFVGLMVPAVRQAVFGNVGTMVVFRVGFEDAEIIRDEFGNEFTAEQIVDLKRFHVLARVHEDETSGAPVRATTLPPILTGSGRPERIVRNSWARFARPHHVVEAKLDSWLHRRL